MNQINILSLIAIAGLLFAVFTPVTRIRQALKDGKKPKTLENYTLTISDESIPRVGLVLQADGKAQDCYFIDAPYALRLADELTMAGARALPKSGMIPTYRSQTESAEFDSLKA